MKKQNKKKIVILSILIVLIFILIFTFLPKLFTGNVILSTSQNNFCGDTDGGQSLGIQSKTSGVVITLNKNSACDWTKINSIYSGFCAFSMSYNDYCYNTKTLRERTCSNNKINTVEVNCPNSCYYNKCL